MYLHVWRKENVGWKEENLFNIGFLVITAMYSKVLNNGKFR